MRGWLHKEYGKIYMNVKIVTFVPLDFADTVRQAMGNAGAGVQGSYTHCSFSSIGTGRFVPGRGSTPFIGETDKLEAVQEERIEVICERSKAKAVIAAMKAAHPYEEAAFDIMPLLSEEELE